ncbi:hypothetical protein YQE_10267, partial [Dendroctonus ponderosae]
MFQVQTAVVELDLRRRMRSRRITIPAVICNGLVSVIVRIFSDFTGKYAEISSDCSRNRLLRVQVEKQCFHFIGPKCTGRRLDVVSAKPNPAGKFRHSRFTDSKKYEEDFLECFKLASPRQGEICNACVLLVKRWKKLPAGSGRHWQHVVDARAGPGMKSFTKFKTKKKKLADKMKKMQFEREYSPALSDKSDTAEATEEMDIAEMDCLSEDGPRSFNSSRNNSPGISDNEETIVRGAVGRRCKAKPRRRAPLEENVEDYIDPEYWTKETICCGSFYRGRGNEMLMVEGELKPCPNRVALCKAKALAQKTATVREPSVKSAFSDSSSDSGYDDSSNQGLTMSPIEHSNRLSESASLATIEEETVKPQGLDLMCHETIFTDVSEVVHSDVEMAESSDLGTIPQ